MASLGCFCEDFPKCIKQLFGRTLDKQLLLIVCKTFTKGLSFLAFCFSSFFYYAVDIGDHIDILPVIDGMYFIKHIINNCLSVWDHFMGLALKGLIL